jgi:hypothetical protein
VAWARKGGAHRLVIFVFSDENKNKSGSFPSAVFRFEEQFNV